MPRKRKTYFEGKVLHHHEYSEGHTEPACHHFEDCGGCKWQHIDYKTQLHYKEKSVLVYDLYTGTGTND